jgi:hypothetical protein
MNDQLQEHRNGRVRLDAPPVFVVGYMHSGTTLLINILKNNSTVFCGNRETKYFMHLPMFRKIFSDLTDDRMLENFVYYVIAVVKTGFSRNRPDAAGERNFNLAWFDGDQNAVDRLMEEARKCRRHDAMFALVSDHMAQAMGKRRWIEKTPTHIFHIEEIVKSIPDALFVEIVRDARDVLASKKTRRTEVWTSAKYADKRQFKNLEKAFDPFWDALAWRAAVSAGQAARKKYASRLFSVRYEDLVSGPERIVRRICDFAGMPFEPEMLNVTTQNSAADPADKPEGIVTTSVGRWRKVLSPAETAVIQWRAQKEMKSLGYEIAQVPALYKAAVPFLLAKSPLEFIQRSYRRWRLGGRLYFQNIFANHLKKLGLLNPKQN